MDLPNAIQAGHREYVPAEMEKPGEYLLLEETSEMVWAGQAPIPGLGPVGSSKDVADGLQGFHLHSVLSVRWPEARPAAPDDAGPAEGERLPVEILGLADQQYLVRQPRPAGAARGDSHGRKKRERESQVWEQASYRVGPAPMAG